MERMTSFARNPVLRRYWYAVAGTSDVLGAPVHRRLLGEDIVVWRGADGRPAAALDRCPHREAPLSAGSVKDGCLVCPYHGWTFDTEGACVLVPSAGAGAPVPPRARLAAVHAADRYGLVWVCLDEPVAGIPEMPWDGDRSFRRLNNPVEEWHASTPRMVDNFLDITHFPFVHLGSFGGAQSTEVPKIELGELAEGFYGYSYDVVARNSVAGATGASGQTTATVSRHMSSGFVLPFACRSTIAYDSGLEHNLLLLSTPMDDEWSYFTFVVWRNDDFSVPADDVLRLDRLIASEDKKMLEQVQGTLPLDATTLVDVQADKASVEWGRQLRALLDA
jgi:phenylpropionate dioxygenase-like ring-hydroxylating dioxygenase large terminal subunit